MIKLTIIRSTGLKKYKIINIGSKEKILTAFNLLKLLYKQAVVISFK